MSKEKCNERIEAELVSRVADLKILLREQETEALGSLADYGLAFDYVAPETFQGQKEAYFRYQLSWGGPSDELRFFVNPDLTCHRIEYWFMDWFDGASRNCSGEIEDVLLMLWRHLSESIDLVRAIKESQA